jgi:hypothetical protein
MKNSFQINAQDIRSFHDERLINKSWPHESEFKFKSTNSIFEFIEANHFYNTKLWNEEDLARRKKVSDNEIAKNKRCIDAFNQHRNDYIEKIDHFILSKSSREAPINGKQNSETLGSMIDRLSILSLKIFHMSIQTQRKDVLEDHIFSCSEKLKILKIQREDLCVCFDQLLNDFINGTRYFKQYKQFKMYNDPKLNPQIYRENNTS